jgi:hypothetical protein
MATPKNLTGKITHLRDRTGGFHVGQTPVEDLARKKTPRERPFAPDYFQLFACLLLGTAAVAQFVLLLWLDIL